MIKNLIKSHLTKNRDLILRETKHLNGFMQLLMKQRNTGAKWTKTERGQLKDYLKRVSLYIPILFIFLLPFGLLFIPVLAEILDRRKSDRRVSSSGTDTNSDSKIELGDEEEAMEAYVLVRRGDDNEVNEVKSMKANWYERR